MICDFLGRRWSAGPTPVSLGIYGFNRKWCLVMIQDEIKCQKFGDSLCVWRLLECKPVKFNADMLKAAVGEKLCQLTGHVRRFCREGMGFTRNN